MRFLEEDSENKIETASETGSLTSGVCVNVSPLSFCTIFPA